MSTKKCPYRKQRPVPDSKLEELVCAAGRNHRLAIVGSDLSYLARICGECPVPDVLSREAKGCLYLLPMRIFEGDAVKTIYHCRVFYDLNPKRPSTTPRWHIPGFCSWWFPHPHSFLPRATEWHTERALGLYLGEFWKSPLDLRFTVNKGHPGRRPGGSD